MLLCPLGDPGPGPGGLGPPAQGHGAERNGAFLIALARFCPLWCGSARFCLAGGVFHPGSALRCPPPRFCHCPQERWLRGCGEQPASWSVRWHQLAERPRRGLGHVLVSSGRWVVVTHVITGRETCSVELELGHGRAGPRHVSAIAPRRVSCSCKPSLLGFSLQHLRPCV